MKALSSLQKKKNSGEAKIQDDIITMLRYKGWYVVATHGNLYQSGFPDLYATHHLYGIRWIEVKKPGMKGSYFTAAQRMKFPLFSAHGTHIHVLVSASETEYLKLFMKENWQEYMMLDDMKDIR